MQESDYLSMKDSSPEKSLDHVIKRLTEIRKSQGISHETLADEIGLHRSAISLIESGKRSPTLLTCLKISKGLKHSLSEIIKETEK